MPNMIIACDAGSAHPVTLATKALCQGNAFRQWASEARAQTASKKDDSSTAVDGSKGMLSQKSQPLHLRASRQSKALHSIKPPHDGSKSGQVELQELFPAESEANVSQKDGTDGSLGDEAISAAASAAASPAPAPRRSARPGPRGSRPRSGRSARASGPSGRRSRTTGRQGMKKCKVSAESLDFREGCLGPFWSCPGAPRPP